jgi:Domain of unknown function (DUF4388)
LKTNNTKDDALMREIREVVREEVRSALCLAAPSAPVQDTAHTGRILSGELRYFRLPELLQLVSIQGLTGRLSMSSEGRHVDIYIRSGAVAYATGDTRSAREQLGFLLVNMGRLTQGALDETLAMCAKTGARLGQTLVEDGVVSSDDIRSALKKQTERSVYKAVAWADGGFSFELCTLPDFVEDMPIGLNVDDLLLEGSRRVGELRLLSEKIPRLDIVFTKPAYTREELAGMELKPEERRALELIDGKKDVAALIAESGMGELGLLRALYALFTVGIIKRSAPAGKAGRTQYL